MHGIDELLQGDAAIVIFVENVKDPFYEKRLGKREKRELDGKVLSAWNSFFFDNLHFLNAQCF